jgi:tRNA nucleotidyltransferase (CCA-adding enzyme)
VNITAETARLKGLTVVTETNETEVKAIESNIGPKTVETKKRRYTRKKK